MAHKMIIATVLVLVALFASVKDAGALHRQLPAIAWQGQILVEDVWFSARLVGIESKPGIRLSGIHEALALVIQPLHPNGMVLVLVSGGRNGLPTSAWWGGPIRAPHFSVPVRGALEYGVTIVLAEYRGSRTPGGAHSGVDPTLAENAAIFSPMLPKYGGIIPKYDTSQGGEWAHGELEDVISVVEWARDGGLGFLPSQLLLVGGSHGAWLALMTAHRVSGITRTVADHVGFDGLRFLQWMRNPPTWPYPGQNIGPAHIYANLQGRGNWDAEAAEGRFWPSENEAFVQRLAQWMGGWDEVWKSLPVSCTLFSEMPASPDILIISDINEWVAPAEMARAYWRVQKDRNPRLRYWERSHFHDTGVFDVYSWHGGDWTTLNGVVQYLLTGEPPENGPIQAGVRVRFLDAITGAPIVGAVLEVSEMFDGCVPAWRASGQTDASGVVVLPSVPAGFVRASVSAPGYQSLGTEYYVPRGFSDYVGYPIGLPR